MQDNNSISQCENTLNSLSSCMNPEQLSVLANLVTLFISNGKNADQLNVLGNFIVAVGSLMLTLAAQKQNCDSKQDKLKQIQDLKKQIRDLECSL